MAGGTGATALPPADDGFSFGDDFGAGFEAAGASTAAVVATTAADDFDFAAPLGGESAAAQQSTGDSTWDFN